MTAQMIVQLVFACIISAGGIGGIVIGVVKFAANHIAEAMNQKFQASLEKEIENYKAELTQELERYKSELSKKEYVTKMRFDAEFQIYRELNAVFFDLVKIINGLIPCGLTKKPLEKADQEKLENERLTQALKLSEDAQDALNKNAPFISEPFYEAYDNILRKCFLQTDVIQEKFNALNFCTNKGKPELEDYKRTEEINVAFRENNKAIRKYLASLEVVE